MFGLFLHLFFYVLFYSPDDHEEDEKNLVYVAVTRAKKCLQLNRTILGILGSRKVSLFLSYAFKLVSPWHLKLAKNKRSQFRAYVNDTCNCKSMVLVKARLKGFLRPRSSLIFEERVKPEVPGEKIFSEQGREPTTNVTHKMTLLLASGIV